MADLIEEYNLVLPENADAYSPVLVRVEDYTPGDIVELVLKLASWSHKEDITILAAEGRKLTVALDQPIPVGGAIYDALDLSGASYQDLQIIKDGLGTRSGNEIYPATVENFVPNHESINQDQTRYKGDKIILGGIIDYAPTGSYTQANAKRKYFNNSEIYAKTREAGFPFYVPLPLLLANYPNLVDPRMRRPLHFMALGMPEGGQRYADIISAESIAIRDGMLQILHAGQTYADITKIQFGQIYDLNTRALADRYKTVNRALKLGTRALKILHDWGYYHDQPTLGNLAEVDVDGGQVALLADWEMMGKMDKMKPVERRLAKLVDLATIYRSGYIAYKQVIDTFTSYGLRSNSLKEFFDEASMSLLGRVIVEYNGSNNNEINIEASDVQEINSFDLHRMVKALGKMVKV
jgi:hypothetical protein